MSTTSDISSKILYIVYLASALYLGNYVRYSTGPVAGIMVFISALFILVRLNSIGGLWNTAEMLVHPIKSAILFTALGVVFTGVSGFGLYRMLLASAGFFLVGGALGALVYKYWNI